MKKLFGSILLGASLMTLASCGKDKNMMFLDGASIGTKTSLGIGRSDSKSKSSTSNMSYTLMSTTESNDVVSEDTVLLTETESGDLEEVVYEDVKLKVDAQPIAMRTYESFSVIAYENPEGNNENRESALRSSFDSGNIYIMDNESGNLHSTKIYENGKLINQEFSEIAEAFIEEMINDTWYSGSLYEQSSMLHSVQEYNESIYYFDVESDTVKKLSYDNGIKIGKEWNYYAGRENGNLAVDTSLFMAGNNIYSYGRTNQDTYRATNHIIGTEPTISQGAGDEQKFFPWFDGTIQRLITNPTNVEDQYFEQNIMFGDEYSSDSRFDLLPGLTKDQFADAVRYGDYLYELIDNNQEIWYIEAIDENGNQILGEGQNIKVDYDSGVYVISVIDYTFHDGYVKTDDGFIATSDGFIYDYRGKSITDIISGEQKIDTSTSDMSTGGIYSGITDIVVDPNTNEIIWGGYSNGSYVSNGDIFSVPTMMEV